MNKYRCAGYNDADPLIIYADSRLSAMRMYTAETGWYCKTCYRFKSPLNT